MNPCIPFEPHWWQWHPYVGVSVLLLGVVGVLVPWLGGVLSNPKKRLWTATMVCLAALELWAIHQDQIQHDGEQAFARCEQQEKFQAIANTLGQSISNDELQYKSTITHVDEVLTNTKTVAATAQANLDEVSGKGSYPCIVPDEMAMTSVSVPFSIWNRGKNVLTGVEVSLHNGSDYQKSRIAGDMKSTFIGTLPPEWPKTIPAISPEVDFAGMGHYNAEIWTQNGVYDEEINIRRAQKGTQAWASQYWLTKMVDGKGPAFGLPKGVAGRISVPMPNCQRQKWSDGSKE